MSYYYGVFMYVVGHALVVGALDGRLIAGHAYGIGYDVRQYLVLLNSRKLKFLQPQIVFSVKSNRFGFHFFPPC